MAGHVPNPERAYSDLLLELNQFIEAGLGDGDEAEAVRGLMDVEWARMTDEQRQRVCRLSGEG